MYHHHYLLSHDINWFALVDGIPVHVASNGGLLPQNSYKISELTRIQHIVHRLEGRYKVGMDVEYLESYLRGMESYPGIDDLTPEEFLLMLPERYEVDRNLSRTLQAYTWSFTWLFEGSETGNGKSFTVTSDMFNGVGYYSVALRAIRTKVSDGTKKTYSYNADIKIN